MNIVNVALGVKSYPIYINAGLLADSQLIHKHITSKQICIVTNQVVANYYLETLQASLSQNNPDLLIKIVILDEGESNKNQTTLDKIYDCLIENKFSRDCLLIALGGGIVGDITGFAAASYQRGVDFIQFPTTVLAQVDSSVGGKTGINHRLGKNLIGAFHQPKAVFIDSDVLKTLPKREISAGMAEVIKYGLIRDNNFLQRLDVIVDELMASHSPGLLSEIIGLSCQHKADVVANDELEKGERATLNLGHTFGHAIETLTHYKTYLHGEAVAIGTMMAAELSLLLGWLSKEQVEKIEHLFKRVGCPTDLNSLDDAQAIYDAMQRDKKVRAGKLKLILLEAPGKSVIRNDIPKDKIITAITMRMRPSNVG